MFKFSVSLLSLCVILMSQAHASDNVPFPRIGGTFNGSPKNYDDPTYQAQLSKVHVAILGAYPGWHVTASNPNPFEQAIKAIKTRNPSERVFQYVILESIGQGEGTSLYKDVWQKIDSMNWWVYTHGTSGSKVLGAWQGGGDGPFYEINYTSFAPPDSNGDRFYDWYAKWSVRTWLTPSPSLDGLYTDNVSWKAEAAGNGDWNRDGVSDASDSSSVHQWVDQGYQKFFGRVRSLTPERLLIGNMSDWGEPSADLSLLSGQLNGGLIEGLIGYSWSPESWAGWKGTLAWYRKTMAASAEPKLVLFHQAGSGTDYQSMRYGLATCLLDDGYYNFSYKTSSVDYHNVAWFDEFDSALGQAISAPPTAAWQNGVYRRDFENGISLVNPKGNGRQTVTLETDFKKLAGKQDPSVNNGQTVRSVTLNDRDGIILLRLTASTAPHPSTAKPAAPQSVIVQ